MNLYGSHTNVVNKCLRDSGDLKTEVQCNHIIDYNIMFLPEVECMCQKLIIFVRDWMFCQELNVFVRS